ncbi:hypothetical protein INT47_000266 [Mucor saturninus]|uniref:CCHC-type domain-containing protein n=1 Tax=Mucor saturninus TaxID=64648 RepID=A0A8H7QDB1_9FUNG|nr:hypothetical protein INT47_000266 [Mucor saturninus]
MPDNIELQKLIDEISNLRRENAELKSKEQQQVISSPEPKVNDPACFHGDPRLTSTFILQLQIVFTCQPLRYASHGAKIGYASSFLRDAAFDWFAPFLRQNNNEVLEDYTRFIQELNMAFGEADAVGNAERKLDTMRQGRQTIATMAGEFRRVAANVSWNESALCAAFYRALNEELKDELARAPRPGTLNELIEACMRIDNRIQERRLERARTNRTYGNSYNTANMFRANHHQPTINPATRPHQYTGPTPMEIDATRMAPRGPLTPEEKDRRRNLGLCLYCGQPGHMARQCPVKSTPMSVHATTEQGKDQVQVHHADLVNQYQIPIKNKNLPLPIYVVDGRELAGGAITKETTTLLFSVGGHTEPATFHVLPFSTYPIILGTSWCASHDPVILSWKSHSSPYNQSKNQIT